MLGLKRKVLYARDMAVVEFKRLETVLKVQPGWYVGGKQTDGDNTRGKPF